MKLWKLKEFLDQFDDNADVVVEIPQKHRMYSNITNVEVHDDTDDGDSEDANTIILNLGSPGYSPDQAIPKNKKGERE